MSTEPLVSVIMPIFNAEKYLFEAIKSILQQTYSNLELILVDDASVDGSLEIVNGIKDSRIILKRNTCNRGIAYSTNRGIEAASGKYIALLDDDDMATAERLQLQVEFMERNEDVDILGGATAEIDENGKIIRFCDIPRYNPEYIKAVLLFNCLDFYNGTSMIRKNFIDKNHLRYKENCYGMQDFHFFIESSKVAKITTIGNLLLYHRLHKKNETVRSKMLYAEERARTYARFQRDSLQMSGFVLQEEQLALINKVLAEGLSSPCDSLEELKNLFMTFKEIVRQARIMQADNLEALELLCKRKLGQQLERMRIFD